MTRFGDVEVTAQTLYSVVIDGATHRVEFRKVLNCPGFSHRVVVDGLAVKNSRAWIRAEASKDAMTAAYWATFAVKGESAANDLSRNHFDARKSGEYKREERKQAQKIRREWVADLQKMAYAD